jgi:hypothetical protein
MSVSSRPLAIAALCLASACSMHDPGTEEGFRVRTASAFEGDAEVGGLTVHLTGALPQVDVPKPHLPTVFHLNAQICSVDPGHGAPPDGDDGAISAEACDGGAECPASDANAAAAESSSGRTGERRCLDLSPTLFAGESRTYVLRAAQVRALLNGSHTALRLGFVTSAQLGSHPHGCVQAGVGEHVVDEGRTNALDVTVLRQRALGFDCR